MRRLDLAVQIRACNSLPDIAREDQQGSEDHFNSFRRQKRPKKGILLSSGCGEATSRQGLGSISSKKRSGGGTEFGASTAQEKLAAEAKAY